MTMTPRNLLIYWKRSVFRNTFRARPMIIPHLIITRSSDDIVLASPKTTFSIPIILLFSVLLVSHDQLCHAKNCS